MCLTICRRLCQAQIIRTMHTMHLLNMTLLCCLLCLLPFLVVDSGVDG
jgi:hypothetical protein